MKTTDRIRAACRMIRYQFGQTPEEKLCFAILEQAIKDAFGVATHPRDRSTALLHLRGELIEAQICGVDPEWIRNILKTADLKLYPFEVSK